jgi:hypothetical protein
MRSYRRAAALAALGGVVALAQEPTQAPIPAQQLERLNAGFTAVQEAFLRERAETTPALRAVLRHHIDVPAPGQAPAEALPLRTPWAALPVGGDVTKRLGLVVSMQLGEEGGPHVAVNGRTNVSFSNRRPELVFDRSSSVRATLGAVESGGDDLEMALGLVSYSQTEDGKHGLQMNLGAAWVNLGLAPGREVSAGAGGGANIHITRFFSCRLGLEGEVVQQADAAQTYFLPVGLHSGPEWARGASARDSVRLVIPASTSCPWCHGAKVEPCLRCHGQGMACTACGRERSLRCDTCQESGRLTCEPQQMCGSCGGDVRRSCGSCGGSGQMMYSSQEACPNEYHYDGNTYEWWTCSICNGSGYIGSTTYGPCGSCGGNGDGGPCDCGDGWVVCGRCGGSGERACDRCSGSGRLACALCSGTGALPCPRCGGEAEDCPLCEGEDHPPPSTVAARPPLPPPAPPHRRVGPPVAPVMPAGASSAGCTCGGDFCHCVRDMLCGGTQPCPCPGEDCLCSKNQCRFAGANTCCTGSHQSMIPGDPARQRCNSTCGCAGPGPCPCSVSCGCARGRN